MILDFGQSLIWLVPCHVQSPDLIERSHATTLDYPKGYSSTWIQYTQYTKLNRTLAKLKTKNN